jgi:hypothetical protein
MFPCGKGVGISGALGCVLNRIQHHAKGGSMVDTAYMAVVDSGNHCALKMNLELLAYTKAARSNSSTDAAVVVYSCVQLLKGGCIQ